MASYRSVLHLCFFVVLCLVGTFFSLYIVCLGTGTSFTLSLSLACFVAYCMVDRGQAGSGLGVGSICISLTVTRRLGVSVRIESSKASHTVGSGATGVCFYAWSASSEEDAACSMQSTQLFVPRTGRRPSRSVELDYSDTIFPSFPERMLLTFFL